MAHVHAGIVQDEITDIDQVAVQRQDPRPPAGRRSAGL
jgi:hypothetical protein